MFSFNPPKRAELIPLAIALALYSSFVVLNDTPS